MDDTAERIRHIIAEVLFMDDEDVRDDSKLEDLGFTQDAIDELREEIEDEFGTETSAYAVDNFITVGDVVKFVRTAVEG